MICKENLTTLGTNDIHQTFIGALTIILINQPKQSLQNAQNPTLIIQPGYYNYHCVKVLSDSINLKTNLIKKKIIITKKKKQKHVDLFQNF